MARLAPLALILIAAGCAPHVALAPAPEIQSVQWRDAPVAVPGAEPVGARGLGAALRSPELDRLTAQALLANADIRIAATRIERARAELKTARAAMLPVVSASAGFADTRTDDVGDSLFRFSQAFGELDLAYDLDLFGSAKAGRRASARRVVAARFDAAATSLLVEADLARAFVQHRALSDRIRLLDKSIADSRELERIVGIRVREGAASRADAAEQAAEARQLEADRSRLAEARTHALNAIALLAGAEAPSFALPDGGLDSVVVPALAPVQPGALLARRPDIAAAEARIEAANGDVAAARRAFLPGLHLSASALGQAATLSGPLGSTLAAGASLLAPIFDRVRLNGRLAAGVADQRTSVELYRKALLTALREAEDALAEIDQSGVRGPLIAAMVDNSRIAARLARLQYLEGDVDLRAALDAERRLVSAEDAATLSRQERLDAAIDLYAAMGGRPS